VKVFFVLYYRIDEKKPDETIENPKEETYTLSNPSPDCCNDSGIE
jgi:hypothetical protein